MSDLAGPKRASWVTPRDRSLKCLSLTLVAAHRFTLIFSSVVAPFTMICVSLGRGRHRMLMTEHAELAQQGISLVELRLDYIRRAIEMRRLLENRPTPVVITVRRPADGGKWRGTEKDRVTILRTAVAEGADYVDLEVDIAKTVPRYGKTKRIISYHNFRETPPDLESIYHRMKDLDPDVIKIATMANNPADNLTTMRLCRNASIPTVAFCMGEIGLPSRLLCGRFGSPFTYATFSEERQLAPGQLTYKAMRDLYRYENITSKTLVYGVIADPVAHSLSPLIHNRAFQDIELDAVYLPFRVPKDQLREFMEIAPELGVHGLSVTIPHKEEILRFATALEPEVAGIKAANTVLFRDSLIVASNTDCNAAIQSLERCVVNEASPDLPLKGKRILVLGNGGVARALGWGFSKRGADVYITGRHHERAEQLAKDLNVRCIDWVAKHTVRPDIIVNGTPVGMHPHVDESPFEKQFLKSHMIVFDTVYNPEQTLLVKHARELGCPVVTGIEMFVRQAARQFEIFTGQKLSSSKTLQRVRKAISAVRYDEDEAKPTTQPSPSPPEQDEPAAD